MIDAVGEVRRGFHGRTAGGGREKGVQTSVPGGDVLEGSLKK